MTVRKTIYENDFLEICEFIDKDTPTQICFGIYNKEIDAEKGGQRELCYLTFSSPIGVSGEDFDTILQYLKSKDE